MNADEHRFQSTTGARSGRSGLNQALEQAAERVTLSINGRAMTVPAGTLLAAALAQAGVTRFRGSIHGEPRGPLCGMGVCFECRVTLNGQPHCRSCLALCEEGMEVRTDE